MQLFYSGANNPVADHLLIEGQEAVHIGRVLRHTPGDQILVTNGAGDLFATEIESVSKSAIHVRVIERKHYDKPYWSGITLAVGILKSRERMESMVEKSVELGVGRIVLLQTERAEREKIRLERFQAVAISAMKQSLQCWLPTVSISRFDSLIASNAEHSIPLILAHEKMAVQDSETLAKFMRSSQVTLCVGPEGGFTEGEVEQAHSRGGMIASLGPNRLRTETAAMHLLSLTRHHQEQVNPSDGVTFYGS